MNICICLVLGLNEIGLLDKLLNDSLAASCPDTGLPKLGKTTIAHSATRSAMETASTPEVKEALKGLKERRDSVEFQRSNDKSIQVTHSITIIKPPYLRSLFMDSPFSPEDSNFPIAPLSHGTAFINDWLDWEYCLTVTPRGRENPWRNNKYINVLAAAKKGPEKSPRGEPRRPKVYEWIVFKAQDW